MERHRGALKKHLETITCFRKTVQTINVVARIKDIYMKINNKEEQRCTPTNTS